MDPLSIGMMSVGAIVVLVYLGLYIPVALGLVSFVSIWIMSDKPILAFNFLTELWFCIMAIGWLKVDRLPIDIVH